jgi:hypothetical protein
MNSKKLRKKLRKQRKTSATQSKKTLPNDPVKFCREWLHYEPYEYIYPFLRDKNHFIANLMARQTGKTFNGMAKILYYAFRYPGSVILITAPKYDQVKNIAFKVLHQHLNRMNANDPGFFEYVIGKKNMMRTMIRFRNGSQILAESPIPETIRGHTAKVVYLMEANFLRDDIDLYTAVLFTLNTTNGYLIAESTPWNTDSIFYKMFNDEAYRNYSTHRIPYTIAMPPNGPLSPEIVEMIKTQLSGDPSRWKREMLCQWTEDNDTWLPTSLITLAQDSNLDYINRDDEPRGEFYLGVDFGKKHDHSVVAVIERQRSHKLLRHLHRFPLDTPYGTVIGYVKKLQETWRTIKAIYPDKTGVGDYIVEDMIRGGLRNVTGINFTDTSKEAMATALKENMTTVDCPDCNWKGSIHDEKGNWRTTCPNNCKMDASPVTQRPLLHIPYDPELFAELNLERYELGKTGKLHFSHPEGTHDDRFWALALAVYSAEMTPPTASKPLAKQV